MNSPGSRRQQSLLDAVQFDHDGALHNPGFVDLAGRPRARKRPPDSRITGPASFTYSASLYGSPIERNVLIQYAFGFSLILIVAVELGSACVVRRRFRESVHLQQSQQPRKERDGIGRALKRYGHMTLADRNHELIEVAVADDEEPRTPAVDLSAGP